MRHALLLPMILAAAPALADPVEGTWRTAADDNGNSGQIAITTCGDTICGKLVKSYHADGTEFASPNIGKTIIWDMAPEGGGAYGGGRIWSPDRDKTYASKMVMAGDRLTVKGCVLFICRDGGTWTRVK